MEIPYAGARIRRFSMSTLEDVWASIGRRQAGSDNARR
jgi:hypothetical protein